MQTTPQPQKPVGFSYAEAESRMRGAKKVKRVDWPADMYLTIELVDQVETILITQPPRKVPFALHDNDRTAMDWIETP